MDIYERLGVRKYINSRGFVTGMGGSRMPPEAYEAMAEAGRCFVKLEELLDRAGAHIARLVGVEACCICSGAAGGMVQAAAACLTGTDGDRVRQLPMTEGWKNEIIARASGPGNYITQGMRATGAHIVEVGSNSSLTAEDVAGAIGEKTAAVQIFLMHEAPKVAEIAAVTRPAGVPLIVDAAAELPPRRNLTQPLADGANLVVFSGGKGIRGPQATGLILGDADLIAACRINGNPVSSIARGMKVGKEDIAALVVALERFVAIDEEEETAELGRRSDFIVAALEGIGGVAAEKRMADPRTRPVLPRVYIELAPDFPLGGDRIAEILEAGSPAVSLSGSDRGLRVDVAQLDESELETVARCLREVLANPAACSRSLLP